MSWLIDRALLIHAYNSFLIYGQYTPGVTTVQGNLITSDFLSVPQVEENDAVPFDQIISDVTVDESSFALLRFYPNQGITLPSLESLLTRGLSSSSNHTPQNKDSAFPSHTADLRLRRPRVLIILKELTPDQLGLTVEFPRPIDVRNCVQQVMDCESGQSAAFDVIDTPLVQKVQRALASTTCFLSLDTTPVSFPEDKPLVDIPTVANTPLVVLSSANLGQTTDLTRELALTTQLFHQYLRK